MTLSIDQMTDERGGSCTFILTGELDMTSAPALTDAVLPMCSNGAVNVVFDINGLEFLDSAGMRAILLCREHLAERNCKLALTRGTASVERLLEIAGLQDVLDRHEDEGRAAPQRSGS
jgi:anti-sigma B factor antagonist